MSSFSVNSGCHCHMEATLFQMVQSSELSSLTQTLEEWQPIKSRAFPTNIFLKITKYWNWFLPSSDSIWLQKNFAHFSCENQLILPMKRGISVGKISQKSCCALNHLLTSMLSNLLASRDQQITLKAGSLPTQDGSTLQGTSRRIFRTSRKQGT